MPRKTTKTTKTANKSIRKTATEKSNLLKDISKRKIPVKSFIIAGIVIGVVLLLGVFKNQFIVATVNGESVTRIRLLSDLEKRQGKEALDNIITEMLVFQEAEKRELTATEDEINSQIKEIETSLEAQGQKLDTLLAAQNVTREDLREQVRIQILLKKMVEPIEVSQNEINEFIEQNGEILPESTDQAQLENQVKQQLEQQKAGEKIQTLVGELQQKAKIEYLLPL